MDERANPQCLTAKRKAASIHIEAIEQGRQAAAAASSSKQKINNGDNNNNHNNNDNTNNKNLNKQEEKQSRVPPVKLKSLHHEHASCSSLTLS